MFSDALDEVPLTGAVTKEHYLRFIKHYLGAYSGPERNSKGHGFATATRLLAMKRPDYFVCLDSANKDGLMKAFNVKLRNAEYEDYWDKIIERLLLAKWWSAPRPSEARQAQVWDGRVAMLDTIFYDP